MVIVYSILRVYWEYLRECSIASTSRTRGSIGRNTASPGSIRDTEPQDTRSTGSIVSIERQSGSIQSTEPPHAASTRSTTHP